MQLPWVFFTATGPVAAYVAQLPHLALSSYQAILPPQPTTFAHPVFNSFESYESYETLNWSVHSVFPEGKKNFS